MLPAGASTASRFDQRLAHRFARMRTRASPLEQFGVTDAPAAAGVAGFAATGLLDDHLHVETHQRTHVGGQRAVAVRDQDGVERCRQAETTCFTRGSSERV
jgi:hypothetical protein